MNSFDKDKLDFIIRFNREIAKSWLNKDGEVSAYLLIQEISFYEPGTERKTICISTASSIGVFLKRNPALYREASFYLNIINSNKKCKTCKSYYGYSAPPPCSNEEGHTWSPLLEG